MTFKNLEFKRQRSSIAVLLVVVLGSGIAHAESGCPDGFIPAGEEKLVNPDFTSFDNFTTDIPYQTVGYPTDANPSAFPSTGIGLVTGPYSQDVTLLQNPFPGDSAPEGGADSVPAKNSWLAYNGNDVGAPTKIWEQVVTGLTPGKDYAYTAYFSNALAPGKQAVSVKAPLVRFEVDGVQIGGDIAVCDGGGELDPVDLDCQVEATEDLWQRLGITVNPGINTSITLSLHDAQVKTAFGNDFAMTSISFKECAPISAAGLSITPDPVNYGAVELGDAATQSVTVQNTGSRNITLGTVPMPASTVYLVAVDNCSGVTLAEGASCMIDVSFTPAVEGPSNGALEVPYVAPDAGSETVALAGTGSVGLDSDGDGVADVVDIDDDNDGIKDVDEEAGDFDRDGIVNRLDLDSDNDGLPDIIEALGTDADNDGRVDGFVDANGDGFHDDLDQTPWELPDTDGDGNKDFLDVDSDGDGVSDIVEAGMTDADGDGMVDGFTDPDGNGWDDNATAVLSAGGLPDSDGDGTPDYRQGVGKVLTRIDGGVGGIGLPLLLGLLAVFALRRRNAAATLVLIFFSAGAHAEKGQVYIGAGAGISMLDPEIVNIPTLSVSDKEDVGFKLLLGYDITNWLSIEGMAAKMGAAGFSNGGEIDYNTYGGSLVATIPHNKPGLSLIGKLGLGTIDNSASNMQNIVVEEVESSEIFAGIGAEYQFNNKFSLRGEYEYIDKDAQLLSLSLLKRFGRTPAVLPPPAPVIAAPEPIPVAPAPVVKKVRLQIEPAYFDTDKATLKPDAIARLDRVVELLKTYSEISLLLITGHTDYRGSDEYNMGLGFRRAKSAYNYLINAGIEPGRLAYESRGEYEPVGDNSTEEGMAQNRRVEFDPTPAEVIEK